MDIQVSNFLRTLQPENLKFMSQKQYFEFLSDSRENNIQYIIYLEKLRKNNNILPDKIKELTKIPYDISLLSTAYEQGKVPTSTHVITYHNTEY